MAVALDVVAPLPLLFEPTAPEERGRSYGCHVLGWRAVQRSDARVRQHEHDVHGARAQHFIAWQVLCGVYRATLAERFGYSERSVQAILCGTTYAAYTAPVLDELRHLGISNGRRLAPVRMREIAEARQRLLEEALWLLRLPAPAPSLVATLEARNRLLSVRWPE